MKKYVLLLLALLCMGSCKKQGDFDDLCNNEAKMQSQRLCPRKVADGIILDSIIYKTQGHMFCYYYTMQDSIYKDSVLRAHRDEVRTSLKNSIINSIELKRFKDKGVAFQYIYLSDVTHTKKMLFTIEPKEYGYKEK